MENVAHTRELDLTGRCFGKLTVLGAGEKLGRGRWWDCACECGGRKPVRTDRLLNGSVASCGCIARRGGGRRTHGGYGTKVYMKWAAMIYRCENPKAPNYANYGGRGISVCATWRASFAAFRSDMGEPPTGRHSLDRIDVNGNYEPGNCRWATPQEQSRNRTNTRYLTKDGKTQSMIAWAQELGMNPGVLKSRVRAGDSDERALRPLERQRPLCASCASCTACAERRKLSRRARKSRLP